MSLPSIPATTTTTIPATDAAVYNLWRLKRFVSMQPDPNGPTQINAVLQKYRVLGDGSWEDSPLLGDVRQLRVADMTALAATQASAATAAGALLTAIIDYATAQNAL